MDMEVKNPRNVNSEETFREGPCITNTLLKWKIFCWTSCSLIVLLLLLFCLLVFFVVFFFVFVFACVLSVEIEKFYKNNKNKDEIKTKAK